MASGSSPASQSQTIHFFFSVFLEELQGQAETYVAVAARRRVAAARHAAEPGEVVPAAAPHHNVGARGRSYRIRLGIRGIVAIPVLTRLPHIAAHIVKPQFVRCFRLHVVSRTAAITVIPRYITNGIAASILVTF